jgi:hypothetical protein
MNMQDILRLARQIDGKSLEALTGHQMAQCAKALPPLTRILARAQLAVNALHDSPTVTTRALESLESAIHTEFPELRIGRKGAVRAPAFLRSETE